MGINTKTLKWKEPILKKKKEPMCFLGIAWILCGFGSLQIFWISFIFASDGETDLGEVKVPTQNWRPYSEMWFPLKVKACLSCIYRWSSYCWAAIYCGNTFTYLTVSDSQFIFKQISAFVYEDHKSQKRNSCPKVTLMMREKVKHWAKVYAVQAYVR